MKLRIAKEKKWAAIAVASVLGLAGCVWVTTLDYLRATITVVQRDGVSPVKNMVVSDYNWITTFKDGSTVSNPFRGVNLKTDAAGKSTFDSTQLSLQSGNLQATSCSDVCVSWGTGYENYCTSYTTYCQDYCAEWAYDSWGDPYCVDWRTTCSDSCDYWAQRSYSYCDLYAQDCNYEYPSRSASDIQSAYAEITYAVGSSWLTTQSQYSTPASLGFQSSKSQNGDTITEIWNENSTFITPLSGTQGQNNQPLVQGLTKRQQAITDARNAGKAKPPAAPSSLGRTFPAAKIFAGDQLDRLTSAQKTALEAARKANGVPK